MPKTNKPSDRLEEIKREFFRKYSRAIGRRVHFGPHMESIFADGAGYEITQVLRKALDKALSQAVENALKSVELEEKIYEDIDGSYNLLRAEGYNQAVEDQRKKHKEVLEKK